MKIDLLISPDGEVGIISDTAFDVPVSGVMVQMEDGIAFLEFEDMDSKQMSVPIIPDYLDDIIRQRKVYIGVMEGREVVDAYDVPLGII